VLGGGSQNSINGAAGGDIVAGGSANFINLAGSSVIGGGNLNTVGDGYHNSYYATIPGGYYNYAQGGFNFAAGTFAQATNVGAFVWSDSLANGNDRFASAANNEFAVRARGGVRLVTGGAGLTVDGVAITGGDGGGAIPGDHSVTVTKFSANSPMAGQVLVVGPDGTSLLWTNPAAASSGWSLTGNSGTTPGNNFIGTTDNQPLNLAASQHRGLELQWVTNLTDNDGSYIVNTRNYTINVVAGSPYNNIAPGVVGSTIAGGGNTFDWIDFGMFGFQEPNNISSDFGVIGGGVANTIGTLADYSVIAGGFGNYVSNYDSFIGGGNYNRITDGLPTLAGTTRGEGNSIGGGYENLVQGQDFGFIGGGGVNVIGGPPNDFVLTWAANTDNTIVGGDDNTIGTNCTEAFIGGGDGNFITDGNSDGTISGGFINQIQTNSYAATIGGGFSNIVAGYSATVPGGDFNVAGTNSFAAGHRAKAVNSGSFVWADNTEADFTSTANRQFAVRANGGVTFTSGNGGGNQAVSWTPGSASWSFSSDRNLKDRFATVDQQSVLDKIAQLPIVEWSYKGYDQRHIGPMAQDFHKLFPLNENDKALQDADLHGVALAAIQGLNQKVEEKEIRIQAQAAQIQQQAEQIAVMQQSLAQLQKVVQTIVERH